MGWDAVEWIRIGFRIHVWALFVHLGPWQIGSWPYSASEYASFLDDYHMTPSFSYKSYDCECELGRRSYQLANFANANYTPKLVSYKCECELALKVRSLAFWWSRDSNVALPILGGARN